MKKLLTILSALLFLSPVTTFAALNTSLVSYWNFQTDSSDSVDGNGGTDTTMSYSSSAVFNGATSKISTAGTGYPTGATARTINLWYKPAGQLGQSLFSYGAASSNAMQQLYYNGSIIEYAGFANDYDVSQVLNNGTWYMITATFDGTTARLYVNGSEIGTGFAASSWNTSASAGCFSFQLCNGVNYPLNGNERYAGVWSRVITGAEMTTLYNAGNGLSFPFPASFSTWQFADF